MKAIRLFRNPNCAKCARIARLHEKFDWRDRLEVSTETPRTGPLRMGEIVIEDLAAGTISHGAEAFNLLCRHIPLYAPFRLLVGIPVFRRYIDREMSGCADSACDPASRP